MEDYFVIGKIVNTQGIKGDLRVVPTTDDISRFELLSSILVDNKKQIVKYDIENIRYHKNFIILKIKGIDDMTSAEKLKNSNIKISKQEALPLNEDEYYIRDLYDMNVVTNEGEELGKIIDIIFTGANDVYVIKNNEEKEILIPAIKQCILNVDIEKNIMTVKLLEGLR